MSVRYQETDAVRQNIAMAASGFVMAATIIGAGLAGLAIGRHVAPPQATAPAITAAAPL